jgi:hypothetical protein
MAQLTMGFLAVTGPLIVLWFLLEKRDSEESSLQGILLDQLKSPDLRGLYSIGIRPGSFFGGPTVTLDLWGCSNERIWETTLRLSSSLPSGVRLVVNGAMERHQAVEVSVMTRRAAACPAGCTC